MALCHCMGLGRVLGEGHLEVLGWVVRKGRESVMGGWVPWVCPPQTLRAILTKATADGLGTPLGMGLLHASLPSHCSDPSWPGVTAAQGSWGLLPIHDSPDPWALPAAPPWAWPLALLSPLSPPTHLPASQLHAHDSRAPSWSHFLHSLVPAFLSLALPAWRGQDSGPRGPRSLPLLPSPLAWAGRKSLLGWLLCPDWD